MPIKSLNKRSSKGTKEVVAWFAFSILGFLQNLSFCFFPYLLSNQLNGNNLFLYVQLLLDSLFLTFIFVLPFGLNFQWVSWQTWLNHPQSFLKILSLKLNWCLSWTIRQKTLLIGEFDLGKESYPLFWYKLILQS